MQILQPEQQAKAAQLLMKCFFDNPMFESILPNEVRRRQLLLPLFECLVDYMMQVGCIYTTSSQLEGMIACVKEYKHQSVILSTRFYLKWTYQLLTRVSWVTLVTAYWRYRTKKRRFIGSFEVLNRVSVYYSIQMFAVDPTKRHQGYARLLLDEVLAKANEEQLSCILETETLQNVLMYQHFNFQMIGSITYGYNEWRQYIMYYPFISKN